MKAHFRVSPPCPMCYKDLEFAGQNQAMITLAHPKNSCSLSGLVFSIHISEVELEEIHGDVVGIRTDPPMSTSGQTVTDPTETKP